MSIEGLGNINTNNASATVTSPDAFLSKTDTDNRKIALDSSKFNTSEDVAIYLSNWLQTQCGVSTSINNSVLAFAIPIANNMVSYSIRCVKDNTELEQFVQSDQMNNLANAGKLVIFGYFSNSTTDVINRLKQVNAETFGIQEIYEVNSAIDSADKKLPYLSINQSKFSSMVAKKVNERYKAQGTFNASTIFGDTHQISSGLGVAFSEGLNQLKESIGVAVGSVKGMAQNQQISRANQATMVEQQMPTTEQTSMEIPEQQVTMEGHTVENVPHPVSLKK